MSSTGPIPTTGLYEPVLPRPFESSDTQRGGYAYLTAIIGIVLAGLTVCLKLQIAASTFRRIRVDDIAVIVATVFAVGYSVAICRAVQYGLGSVDEEISSTQLRLLSKHYYASNIMLYLSLACAKCSVALLIIALQPTRWVSTALYGVLVLSITWGVVAVFVIALKCRPTRWILGPTGDSTCINQYAAQIGLKSGDILLDVALVVLPSLMVLGIQLSPGKRLIVASIFSLRVTHVALKHAKQLLRANDLCRTPIFTAISLASLSRFYSASTADRAFASVSPSIWTSVAINVSLITACLPSIKRFVTDWAAGVANAQMEEPFEMQSLSADALRSGQSSGNRLRSIGRSKRHTGSASMGERDIASSSKVRGGMSDRDQGGDDGDSKKGLTDGILQTVDFDVEYRRIGRRRDSSPSLRGMAQ